MSNQKTKKDKEKHSKSHRDKETPPVDKKSRQVLVKLSTDFLGNKNKLDKTKDSTADTSK